MLYIYPYTRLSMAGILDVLRLRRWDHSELMGSWKSWPEFWPGVLFLRLLTSASLVMLSQSEQVGKEIALCGKTKRHKQCVKAAGSQRQKKGDAVLSVVSS
jgi:hypothetical protein